MPSLPYVSLPSMPTQLWDKMRSWRLSSSGKRPRDSLIFGRHSTGSFAVGSPTAVELEDSHSLADFELRGVLGRGTFGVVRLARHRATGRAVALKILDKHRVQEMKQEVHLLREQSVHLRLNHAFIGRSFATFQDTRAVYFVLEYCPGGELYSLVYPQEEEEEVDTEPTSTESEDDDELATNNQLCDTNSTNRQLFRANFRAMRALAHPLHGGLRENHVAFYAACVVSGLAYLHDAQDVLYRDLKLENLVLGEDGYPRLIDFGLSKPDASRQQNATMCGSKEYIAPEIVQRQPYDHRVDLWALGVLLYELFFGTTPFYHANQRELSRRICEQDISFPKDFERESPNACALMRSLLAKNPDERPLNCRAVKQSAFFQQHFPTAKAWHQLESKQMRAPFVPTLSGPFDASLFANAYDEDDEDAEEAFDF